MEPQLQELLKRGDRLSDQLADLRDGIRKAIRVADDDPEMALIRARKVLEYVVRDVFERRIGEPPGTRPLEDLVQRLVKDGHLPARHEAYTETIRKLGNVGAHRFGEAVTAADVYQSLAQLLPILEWYLEKERPEAGNRVEAPAVASQLAATPPKRRHVPWLWVYLTVLPLVAVLGIVINIVTDTGTVKITGTDPDMVVRIDGRGIRIENLGKPIALRTGAHELELKRGDLVVKTQTFQIQRWQETSLRVIHIPKPSLTEQVSQVRDLTMVTGLISATEDRAVNDARLQLVKIVRDWMEPDVPNSWQGLDLELDSLNKEVQVTPVEKEYGTLYVATLYVDLSPAKHALMAARYQLQQANIKRSIPVLVSP
jgi:hypothetical protein